MTLQQHCQLNSIVRNLVAPSNFPEWQLRFSCLLGNEEAPRQLKQLINKWLGGASVSLRTLTAGKKTRDVLRVQSSIYHSVFGRTGTAVERVLAL